MKRYPQLYPTGVALFVLALGVPAGRASIESFTGTLPSPESTADFVVTLSTASTVVLQTYGFGGGTNAAGTVILPGGTDPFLAIFSGTGSSATIVTDGSGNPFGTSLDLSNYDNPNFLGCPPAHTQMIGGGAACADITMSLSLGAGSYTVLLSDGQYQANAVFDNGTLGKGFSNFTGGSFCNLVINGVACPNTSGAYALDITTSGTIVPEPGTLSLLTACTFAFGLIYGVRQLAAARLRK
jgi:hypothetical protein